MSAFIQPELSAPNSSSFFFKMASQLSTASQDSKENKPSPSRGDVKSISSRHAGTFEEAVKLIHEYEISTTTKFVLWRKNKEFGGTGINASYRRQGPGVCSGMGLFPKKSFYAAFHCSKTLN